MQRSALQSTRPRAFKTTFVPPRLGPILGNMENNTPLSSKIYSAPRFEKYAPSALTLMVVFDGASRLGVTHNTVELVRYMPCTASSPKRQTGCIPCRPPSTTAMTPVPPATGPTDGEIQRIVGCLEYKKSTFASWLSAIHWDPPMRSDTEIGAETVGVEQSTVDDDSTCAKTRPIVSNLQNTPGCKRSVPMTVTIVPPSIGPSVGLMLCTCITLT